MKRLAYIAIILMSFTAIMYPQAKRIGKGSGGNALKITTLSLPNGTNGTAYSSQVFASGGKKPYAWTQPTGTLPTGLSIASGTGIISGTPTVNGVYTFGVRVTDAASTTYNRSFIVTISGGVVYAPLVIDTTSVPAGKVNSLYATQLLASGGSGTVTWSVVSGSLPAGVSLTGATGVIGGTPTSSGTFPFTARATDSTASLTKDQAYTLTVAATTYLFSDGFESGCTVSPCTGTTSLTTLPYFPAWTTTSCGSGGLCPTVQSGTKHAGTYAYQQQYTILPAGNASQDLNRWVSKVFATGMSSAYTRAYLYFKTPTIATEVDDLVQRKILRWSDSGNLPGTQYDFLITSWTTTGGTVHPTYLSLAMLSQTTTCPFTGVVNTSGTTVTRVSGALFNTNTSQANGSGPWANTSITINGTAYTIASVSTTGTLTLTASAGTQTSVPFNKTFTPFQVFDITNLNYDTWYSVEAFYSLNTAGQPDGLFKLWIDGVLVSDLTTVMYRGYGCSNNVNFFGYGAQANRYSNNALDELRFIDDVVINDSGPIGP